MESEIVFHLRCRPGVLAAWILSCMRGETLFTQREAGTKSNIFMMYGNQVLAVI
jgi:hypothetical protein